MTKGETMHWGIALEGPDLIMTTRWLRDVTPYSKPPLEVIVDLERKTATPDWLERWSTSAQRSLGAFWDSERTQSLVLYPERVVAARFSFARNVQEALAWLSPAPFEVASFATIHDNWDEIDPDYSAPSFSHNHFRHGWGCAFKGAGHKRLVSRRWLDHGPWRLWRAEGDVSLVQFHNLAADGATALAQAKPGHVRMGISEIGGFLQKGYVYEQPPNGLYSAAECMLRIVVVGRDLTPVELRDACAARYYQAFDSDGPVERIAYVFTDATAAQRHLHELWLHDLECWTLIDGREIRLDDNYDPTPTKPEWVLAIND